MEHICKYCGKEFPSGVALGGHTVWCQVNPKRGETSKKLSKTLRKNNPMHNPDTRKKMSDTVNEKIKNGDWHVSFSRSRTHIYNGIKFHGKWELNYAKYLDDNGIKWRRPDERFEYKYEGKIRNYTPDFYLIEGDKYIEIKGYPTLKDKAKWDHFPMDLEILFGEDLVKLGVINTCRKITRPW